MTKYLILLLLFVTTMSNSQALLLKKGQSGTNIGVGLGSLGQASNVYLDAGFSPNGLLNFGLGVGKSSIDGISNYGEIFILPYIQYFFIKQDRNVPLSVGIGASYQRTNDTGKYLEDEGLSLKGNAFSGSISVAHNIDASRSFRLIPFGNVNYTHSKVNISDGIDELSTSNNIVSGRIGVIAAIAVNDHYFNITPSLLINKDDTGFGIFISYNIQ